LVNEISEKTPNLCHLAPAGPTYMEDLNEAGGVYAVLNEINKLGLLDTNVMTCTGKTLGENIANITDNTFINCTYTGSNGGIVFFQNSYLKGNEFINCTSTTAILYSVTDFNAKIRKRFHISTQKRIKIINKMAKRGILTPKRGI
jgi:hypothetical protein